MFFILIIIINYNLITKVFYIMISSCSSGSYNVIIIND